MTTVYHLDEAGRCIGESRADVDPLNPSRLLVPRQATREAPPSEPAPAGKEWRYGRRVVDTVAGVGINGEPITGEVYATDWHLCDLPAPAVDPQPAPPSAAEIRRAEIIAELCLIDMKSIRPLREGEAARVAELAAQAALLRVELAGLGA